MLKTDNQSGLNFNQHIELYDILIPNKKLINTT